MSWFGIAPFKKFPTPVSAIIGYGVNSAQTALMNSDEFKNDPRNPNAKAAH